MIEQTVTVLSVDKNSAQVAALKKTECARCAEGQGCGGASLARLFGEREFRLDIPTQIDFQSGDMAVLAIEDRLLLSLVLRQYGFPLLSFISCALLAHLVFANELFVVFAGGAGLSLALVLLRLFPLELASHVRLLRKAQPNDCGLAKPL